MLPSTHDNPYHPPNATPGPDAGFPFFARDSLEIEFAGSMSVAEFHCAVKLSKAPGGRAAILIGRTVLAYWCIHMAAATVFSASRREYQVTAISAMLFLVAFGIGCIIVCRNLRAHRAIIKQWQDRSGYFAKTKGCITDVGIRINHDDSPILLEWTTFIGYRASPEIVILYGNAQCPSVIVARSKFRSDSDWQAFATTVRSRLQLS